MIYFKFVVLSLVLIGSVSSAKNNKTSTEISRKSRNVTITTVAPILTTESTTTKLDVIISSTQPPVTSPILPLKIILSTPFTTTPATPTKLDLIISSTQPPVTSPILPIKIILSTSFTTTPATPTKLVPTKKSSVKKSKTAEDLICPKDGSAEFQWFPLLCKRNSECKSLGKEFKCCKQYGNKRCIKGIPKPLKEQSHEPILWVLPRKCPTTPLAELWWELKTCKTDQDCWPRVCCPDGTKKYCRTSRPEFEKLELPAARQLSYPFESVAGYLQCTPPPPKVFDQYPKSCNNTLDCFPNVCCQEDGKKHCRPPRRSLLALLTGVSQRFNVGIFRQWSENLVIK